MEFLVQEILQLNVASQDSDSDDDVSALSGFDSKILETVEKADFVEFLDNDSSTLAGSEGDFRYILGNLQIASVYNFWQESAKRKFGFLQCQMK